MVVARVSILSQAFKIGQSVLLCHEGLLLFLCILNISEFGLPLYTRRMSHKNIQSLYRD